MLSYGNKIVDVPTLFGIILIYILIKNLDEKNIYKIIYPKYLP